MFGRKFTRQKPGDPIQARTINAPLAEVERLGKSWAAAPLSMQDGPAGALVRTSVPVVFWAKLTSGSNPYSFAEVYADASGTWTLTPEGMTGSAYELNGNTALATFPLYVRIRRSEANDFRFESGTCP